jgi:hypothetical protein
MRNVFGMFERSKSSLSLSPLLSRARARASEIASVARREYYKANIIFRAAIFCHTLSGARRARNKSAAFHGAAIPYKRRPASSN